MLVVGMYSLLRNGIAGLMETFGMFNRKTLNRMTIVSWKVRVVMMPTLSSQVVVMTTCGANSDDKVGIMTILNFQGLPLSHQCYGIIWFDVICVIHDI